MKPKLIIIEGSQGVGKGVITTLLREKIPYSTLMRLSGIKDNTKETGLNKVYKLTSYILTLIFIYILLHTHTPIWCMGNFL